MFKKLRDKLTGRDKARKAIGDKDCSYRTGYHDSTA